MYNSNTIIGKSDYNLGYLGARDEIFDQGIQPSFNSGAGRL